MSEPVFHECPYCGERVELMIDEGGADRQSYIEDCPVCCRPWNVSVRLESDGSWNVTLQTEDD